MWINSSARRSMSATSTGRKARSALNTMIAGAATQQEHVAQNL